MTAVRVLAATANRLPDAQALVFEYMAGTQREAGRVAPAASTGIDNSSLESGIRRGSVDRSCRCRLPSYCVATAIRRRLTSRLRRPASAGCRCGNTRHPAGAGQLQPSRSREWVWFAGEGGQGGGDFVVAGADEGRGGAGVVAAVGV